MSRGAARSFKIRRSQIINFLYNPTEDFRKLILYYTQQWDRAHAI